MISFTINGKPYSVSSTDHPIDLTLNTFIREYAQLPGTKFMCLEGGCGVCICVIKGRHPVTKEYQIWATNSCLTLLNSCDGWDILTIEGIGNKKDGYHPVQERLAHMNGTQCGYCSPAMVMNMYALLEATDGKLTMEEVENSFGGNLCRCTGYRPILDAMKSFATDFIDIDFPCEDDDIEDVSRSCSKSNKLCAEFCKYKRTHGKHVIFDNGLEWYSAKTIDDIFEAFGKIGDKKYMLVAGNTAHGVYRRSNDIEVFIDVNQVTELHDHKFDDNKLILGGNLSLTETMKILLEAAKKAGFEYCKRVYDHFDLIANVPVRNMGTLAGNLSIKYNKEEFPSDVFISLEGINAQISVITNSRSRLTVTPQDYLKMDMTKSIIETIKLRKYNPQEYFYNSYKIMPRAQNAHAYVNAAFLIQMKNGKVDCARMCFGGINPKFVHATNTEKYLIGKDLFDNETVKKSLEILNAEIQADWVLPDASPEYRQLLASGLFYKFVLNIGPDKKIKSNFKSGGTILKRDLSSGTQTFETNEKVFPVTKAIPKIEALIQCSGEAFYVNDLPKQPNQLWAAFVHATEANVKIAEIDSSAAVKLPGVVAFFSAKDVPGKNSFVDTNYPLPMYFEDEEIFASEKIRYFAQPIGIIVAESSRLAQEAALKVKVLYEKLGEETLSTLQDVIEKKAWNRCFDTTVKLNDTKLQLDKQLIVSKKIQGNLEIGSQYHFTMEPHTTVCIPTENGMDVYCATQFIDFTRIVIANALNIKENSILIRVSRLGGGYGAKISRGNQIACACALACKKLNVPIRFVQTIESMMSSIGKRFACISDYEVEVNDSGKIVDLKNTFWEDGGCTVNESPVDILSVHCSRNCYDSASWKINAKIVKTDAPSHTWCRAPGALEGIAMIENIMEHIAEEINKSPVDVRMANIPSSNPIHNLLPEFIKSIDYTMRKEDIKKFNSENRWKKKGLGIAVMEYPVDYYGYHTVLLSVYHGDGTVSITHGGIEMGQGINTKVAQVAAYALGIPMNMIRIHETDSFTTANSTITGGGVGSESVCYATRKACNVIIERMKSVRDTLKDPKWEDLVKKCYENQIILTVTASHKVGEMKTYKVYGLGCTEVEVDMLTGNLIITRVDILEDTGESLSPMVDVGQIEGAFIMGIGYWLTEQLLFNRQNGELLTTRTWNYKIPGVKDIPIDFRINLFQKQKTEAGFMRSKTTGEPSMCLAISVLFALRHAINSSRKDAGIKDKWYHLGAPTMPENILLASGNSIKQYSLN